MKIWQSCDGAFVIAFICFCMAACDGNSTEFAQPTTSTLNKTLWEESVETNEMFRASPSGTQSGEGIEWYSDSHPLFTTISLFPTLEQLEGQLVNDTTLVDYLSLSVCEVSTAATCNEIQVLKAVGCSIERGCATAGVADFYQAIWNISGRLLGEELEVHFVVAGLDIGFIEVVPKVSTVLPIRFAATKHPRIRARILTEQGHSVEQIADMIMQEFDLDTLQVTRLCFEEGHEVLPIAAALKGQQLDAYRSSQVLTDVGFKLSDVYKMLQETYGKTRADTGPILVRTLTERGYSTATIAGILQGEFSFAPAEIAGFLLEEDHNGFIVAAALRGILNVNAQDAAHILTDSGFDVPSVDTILQKIFRVGPLGSAEILADVLTARGHSLAQVLKILRGDLSLSVAEISQLALDVSGTTPEALASTLFATSWTCGEVGELLRSVYDLEDPVRTGDILNAESCGAEAIYRVFVDAYGLNEFESESVFADMGWPQQDYLWITAYKHVKQFAPQLLFDSKQSDFPMDAESWFEFMLCKGGGMKSCFAERWDEASPFSNTSRSVLRDGNSPYSTVEGGRIPTYYRMSTCYRGQLRIEYWWFYGYQQKCDLVSGAHPADWERVLVITNDSRTDVAAILFYQHGGWYIRNGQFWGKSNPPHPDVYIGGDNHGSYYTSGGMPYGGCLYFQDRRRPDWRDVPDGTLWKTWEYSTFINVQGPQYSPDLPDKVNQPKEWQQYWIQYTKKLGDKFPWSYDDDREGQVWTNPLINDGGIDNLCNRVACKGYAGDEGCIGTHTRCKHCSDHTNMGAHCAESSWGTPTYAKHYWVPTWDRGLYSVISGPKCTEGGNYCPCGD